MQIEFTSILHTLCSVISLSIGCYIFFQSKGTVSHKTNGWVFTICMLISIISSFFIYHNSNNGFSLIHILSVIGLYNIYIAISCTHNYIDWQYRHARAMGWVYISLISTVVSAMIRYSYTNEEGYVTNIFVLLGVFVPSIFIMLNIVEKFKNNKLK
jgi:uncharacterized membrane protein